MGWRGRGVDVGKVAALDDGVSKWRRMVTSSARRVYQGRVVLVDVLLRDLLGHLLGPGAARHVDSSQGPARANAVYLRYV